MIFGRNNSRASLMFSKAFLSVTNPLQDGILCCEIITCAACEQ